MTQPDKPARRAYLDSNGYLVISDDPATLWKAVPELDELLALLPWLRSVVREFREKLPPGIAPYIQQPAAEQPTVRRFQEHAYPNAPNYWEISDGVAKYVYKDGRRTGSSYTVEDLLNKSIFSEITEPPSGEAAESMCEQERIEMDYHEPPSEGETEPARAELSFGEVNKLFKRVKRIERERDDAQDEIEMLRLQVAREFDADKRISELTQQRNEAMHDAEGMHDYSKKLEGELNELKQKLTKFRDSPKGTGMIWMERAERAESQLAAAKLHEQIISDDYDTLQEAYGEIKQKLAAAEQRETGWIERLRKENEQCCEMRDKWYSHCVENDEIMERDSETIKQQAERIAELSHAIEVIAMRARERTRMLSGTDLGASIEFAERLLQPRSEVKEET